jgi:hypothetical protein
MKNLFLNKKIVLIIVGVLSIAMPKNIAAQAFEDLVVDSVIALPIKLQSFSANRMEKNVQINWTVETEKNLSYFTIQRSYNGEKFEDVSNVKSTSLKSYSLIDKNIEDKNVYYRLECVDNDGKSSFSNIILLKYNSNNLFDVSVYPNPVINNILNISIKNVSIGKFNLELKDFKGSTIVAKSLNSGFTNTAFSLDLPKGISKGVYILNAYNNNGLRHTQKIIIK